MHKSLKPILGCLLFIRLTIHLPNLLLELDHSESRFEKLLGQRLPFVFCIFEVVPKDSIEPLFGVPSEEAGSVQELGFGVLNAVQSEIGPDVGQPRRQFLLVATEDGRLADFGCDPGGFVDNGGLSALNNRLKLFKFFLNILKIILSLKRLLYIRKLISNLLDLVYNIFKIRFFVRAFLRDGKRHVA